MGVMVGMGCQTSPEQDDDAAVEDDDLTITPDDDTPPPDDDTTVIADDDTTPTDDDTTPAPDDDTTPISDDDTTSAPDDDTTPFDDDTTPVSDDDSTSGEDDTVAPSSWRSLLYPSDWTPAFTDPSGAFLHDFSYAGYHRSELPLPEPSSFPGSLVSVVDFGADASGETDSTAAFQAAIDALSPGGGRVWVPPGTFRIDATLAVESSGVVIQGEGPTSRVYFTQGTGVDSIAHLTFRGAVTEGPDLLLAEDAEPRSLQVSVADASTLAPGMDVLVGHLITDEFIADHDMTGTWVTFNGQWKAFLRRTIVAVDTGAEPDRVTLDAPVRGPLLMRDGASLRVENGALEEVGIFDLALSNSNDHSLAWSSTRNHILAFLNVKDAVVSGITSWESPLAAATDPGRHLLSNGVLIQDSKRVTVAHCWLGYAQNRGGGGNGYLYEIMRSGEILVRDSSGIAGRHNFIQNWDFGTSGCVWLRVTSQDGRALPFDSEWIWTTGLSEYHHSLSTANLVDGGVATDGWQGVNRHDESSGAGHSATECVFWNLGGGGMLRSLQWDWGYVIAPNDMDLHVDPEEWAWDDPGEGTEPQDWVEGEGESLPVEPESLFEDQLARRLKGS